LPGGSGWTVLAVQELHDVISNIILILSEQDIACGSVAKNNLVVLVPVVFHHAHLDGILHLDVQLLLFKQEFLREPLGQLLVLLVHLEDAVLLLLRPLLT
jgi:hypothetical protein